MHLDTVEPVSVKERKSYLSAQTRPASLGQSLPRLGRSPIALKNRLQPVVVWPYFDNDGIAVELRP